MSEPIVTEVCGMCGNIEALEYFINNIPEFLNVISAETKESIVLPHETLIVYPLLTADSKWVDKNGNIVGVLGDDISNISQEQVFS